MRCFDFGLFEARDAIIRYSFVCPVGYHATRFQFVEFVDVTGGGGSTATAVAEVPPRGVCNVFFKVISMARCLLHLGPTRDEW